MFVEGVCCRHRDVWLQFVLDVARFFEVLEPRKRPVSAVADYTEIRDVKRVSIRESPTATLTLLFDPEHNLEDRILNEQFIP